jgi:hypothetical protein
LDLTPEEFDVLERLDRWNKQFQQLLAMFDGQGAIHGPQVVFARELYGAIKGELESECRWMNNRRRKSPLTLAERRWYERPIQEAQRLIRATTNAFPEDWRPSLRKAQACLTRAMNDLRAKVRTPQTMVASVGPAGVE